MPRIKWSKAATFDYATYDRDGKVDLAIYVSEKMMRNCVPQSIKKVVNWLINLWWHTLKWTMLTRDPVTLNQQNYWGTPDHWEIPQNTL